MPASSAATVTVSAFDSLSLPMVMSRAIVLGSTPESEAQGRGAARKPLIRARKSAPAAGDARVRRTIIRESMLLCVRELVLRSTSRFRPTNGIRYVVHQL